MPEAERVQELVLHGAQAVAVTADGQPLLPLTTVPHGGEAAVRGPQTQRGNVASSCCLCPFAVITMFHRVTALVYSFVVLAIDDYDYDYYDDYDLIMMNSIDVVITNNCPEMMLKHNVIHLSWIAFV